MIRFVRHYNVTKDRQYPDTTKRYGVVYSRPGHGIPRNVDILWRNHLWAFWGKR